MRKQLFAGRRLVGTGWLLTAAPIFERLQPRWRTTGRGFVGQDSRSSLLLDREQTDRFRVGHRSGQSGPGGQADCLAQG